LPWIESDKGWNRIGFDGGLRLSGKGVEEGEGLKRELEAELKRK
jgi:hypothetical protein